MVKSAESVEIQRSPEDVFAFVADLRNEPSWHVDIDMVPPDTDAVPVVGKTYPVKFKPFFGMTDGEFTALEVVPGSRIVQRGKLGGLEPTITYEVSSSGAGARFTRSVDLRPHGLAVVMTPVMAMMVPRRNKVFVENLKRVLES